MKMLIVEDSMFSRRMIERRLKEYAAEMKTLNKKLIEQEKRITQLARYDDMTGPVNRTFFYNIAKRVLNGAKRNRIIQGRVI